MCFYKIVDNYIYYIADNNNMLSWDGQSNN